MASHGDDRALEASERMMGEDAVVAVVGGVPLLPRARWGWLGRGRGGGAMGCGGAGAIFGDSCLIRCCWGGILPCPLRYWGGGA